MLAKIVVKGSDPLIEEIVKLAIKRKHTWGSKFLEAVVVLSNYPYQVTFFGPMKEAYENFVEEPPKREFDHDISMPAFPHVLSVEDVITLSSAAIEQIRASEDRSMWGIIFEVRRYCELVESDPPTYLVARWPLKAVEEVENGILKKYGQDYATGIGAWFFNKKHPVSKCSVVYHPPFPLDTPAEFKFVIYGSEQLRIATKIKRLIEQAEPGFSYKDREQLVNDLVSNGMILGRAEPNALLFYAPGKSYKEILEFIHERLKQRPCLICGNPVGTTVRKTRVCKSRPCQGRFDRLKRKARELYDQGTTKYTDLCRALHKSHLEGQEYLKKKGRHHETWQAYDLKELIKFVVHNITFEQDKKFNYPEKSDGNEQK